MLNAVQGIISAGILYGANNSGVTAPLLSYNCG
jgi:hypothetical protein